VFLAIDALFLFDPCEGLLDSFVHLFQTKDDVAFFAYLRLFVDCYQRSLHRGDSRDDDSLKLSNLPENLLSKISSHLMYYNHKETKVSMMNERQKKNIIMVIQSLSTLSRYVFCNLYKTV